MSDLNHVITHMSTDQPQFRRNIPGVSSTNDEGGKESLPYAFTDGLIDKRSLATTPPASGSEHESAGVERIRYHYSTGYWILLRGRDDRKDEAHWIPW